jgi:O-antigen ligase
MAAASPYLKDSSGSGFGLMLGMLGLVAVGAACGVLLAMGEIEALYICLSIVAGVAVLFDFRIGAVLLIMLLPLSGSNVFPHSLMGLKGLNPINLLILATLGSYLLHGRVGHTGKLAPKGLLCLYLVPFLLAGILGSQHADHLFPLFYELQAVDFTDASGYIREVVLKPGLMVVVALLIAASVNKSHKPERFLVPIIVSVWAMCVLEIVFVVISGVRLGELADTNARQFTLGIVGLALLLTFSRGAFLGFIVVSALFLLWKFNSKTLGLALLGAVVIAVFAPGALYRRVTFGFDSGDVDTLSAGRVDGIWLPLLPEIWRSPLFGNGMRSVMWSYPMMTESMTMVDHPHNAYLEAVLDAGFIGLACFLVYYYTVYRGFRSLGGHAFLSPTLRGFFQGATAGLAAFFVTGWSGSSLMPRYEWSLLWVAIGMMYGLLSRRPAS